MSERDLRLAIQVAAGAVLACVRGVPFDSAQIEDGLALTRVRRSGLAEILPYVDVYLSGGIGEAVVMGEQIYEDPSAIEKAIGIAQLVVQGNVDGFIRDRHTRLVDEVRQRRDAIERCALELLVHGRMLHAEDVSRMVQQCQ